MLDGAEESDGQQEIEIWQSDFKIYEPKKGNKLYLDSQSCWTKSVFAYTVQNLKKKIFCSLPQISGQSKSEAKESEGLVKITYGFVASSFIKIAGSSKYENFLNCTYNKTSNSNWRLTKY